MQRAKPLKLLWRRCSNCYKTIEISLAWGAHDGIIYMEAGAVARNPATNCCRRFAAAPWNKQWREICDQMLQNSRAPAWIPNPTPDACDFEGNLVGQAGLCQNNLKQFKIGVGI